MVKKGLLIALILCFVGELISSPPIIETDTLSIPDSIPVIAGDTVNIPIYMSNTAPIVAFALNIKYDTLLNVIDAQPGEAIDSFWTGSSWPAPAFAYNPDNIDSVIRIVAYTQGPLDSACIPPGKRVIAYLVAAIPENLGVGTVLPLIFYDDTTCSPGRYNVITNNIDFTDKLPIKDNGSIKVIVSDVSEAGCYHPVDFDIELVEGKAVLMFTLPESRYAEVKLYSVDGRCVAELFKGLLTEGATRIERNLSIPSGMYFVRALMGPDMITKKVIVLRGGGCIRGGEIRSKKGGGRGPEDNRMGLGVKTRRGKSCGKNEK